MLQFITNTDCKMPVADQIFAVIEGGCRWVQIRMKDATDDMLTHINREHVQLLPNTSGVRNAKEAVVAARMSREIFDTPFIKLEIHPDPRYLMPDPVETLKATEILAAEGFTVLPYIQADAFRLAVIAGRKAYLAGLGAVSKHAVATPPLTSFLD